ncbi:hypothetical protein LOTGIDRAFT_106792 [Lottia gigantea]|uniref:Caspase-3 n=1 Tax=Lottia gigantea TaxID=225164 RepID=V4BKD3_LOTGI|nr:hypothetical protein LOTGIDRAFT_106792 [Lottia gigantea]ESO89044.1 hypothetical protein LOTGIDRAFT_106792 [Lottia gigantea]
METEEAFYSEEYAMNKPNRGVAIIINNVSFHPSTQMGERTGSDKDHKALKQRFKELEFDVREFKNLKRDDMESLMKKVAGESHDNNDCFMCAMLSHGEEGTIYGFDGPIEIQRLIEPFKGHNCRSLAGKPKIFFIQACRGSKLDAGVEQQDSKGSRESETIEYKVQRIPTEADFLIAYSVVPGYFSWRNSANGSWFVQAISEVFRKYGQKLDLMTLMTRVNKLVAYNFESNASKEYMTNKKQIPCITSMLTKDVYFRSKN